MFLIKWSKGSLLWDRRNRQPLILLFQVLLNPNKISESSLDLPLFICSTCFNYILYVLWFEYVIWGLFSVTVNGNVNCLLLCMNYHIQFRHYLLALDREVLIQWWVYTWAVYHLRLFHRIFKLLFILLLLLFGNFLLFIID